MASGSSTSSTSNIPARFCSFIDGNPTPFHVAHGVSKTLASNGFVRLSERQPWRELRPGGKYFFTRNASTIVAFAVGGRYDAINSVGGFKIVAAHTDSPALKLKPVSKRDNVKGYVQVGIETYGGGLWHTWLDRDLGIAGRVVVKSSSDSNVQHRHRLVHINRPILRIPSLCIHLQSGDERNALKINAEDHLTAILGLASSDLNASATSGTTKSEPATPPASSSSTPVKPAHSPLEARHPSTLITLLSRELGVDPSSIVDLDLTLTDTQRSCVGGVNEEFVFAPRLDNQMHCFTSTEALLAFVASGALQDDADVSMVCLFDHEEVGSESSGGAGSPIVSEAVDRITACLLASASSPLPSSEAHKIALSKSLILSADGAHAIHPNYQNKHEMNHQPKVNGGTVIKTNSNMRYATNGSTGFIVREVARRAGVPVQEFVVKQDLPCGTTVGPILAAKTGIRAVDVGIPQLSMHSIRETCGTKDLETNVALLREFFKSGREVDEGLAGQNLSDEEDGHDVVPEPVIRTVGGGWVITP